MNPKCFFANQFEFQVGSSCWWDKISHFTVPRLVELIQAHDSIALNGSLSVLPIYCLSFFAAFFFLKPEVG